MKIIDVLDYWHTICGGEQNCDGCCYFKICGLLIRFLGVMRIFMKEIDDK